MKTRATFSLLFIAVLSGLRPSFSLGADKVTYVADVMPILRNSCLNCHNPDKHKAGLDMTTYQAMMQGSDSGKVIQPGNPGNSLLLKLISHTDEPAMPPKSDKLPDSQINMIRRWIEGYALENTDSQAAAIAKSGTPALEMFAEEKPGGPPLLPCDLLLEPVVRTKRPGAVVSLAASPAAPIVAMAAQKQVLLYNTATLELAGVLPFPEGFPRVVKFSRDGRLVLAGGGIGAKSGRVVVWDVTTGRRVLEAGDEFDEVLAADISPDHHFIALGGPGRMVKIFQDGKLVHSIKKHTDWVTALAFTSDGKMLVSGDRQGGLEVWETATGGEMFALTGLKGAVTAICAPGPEACFTSSEDGTAKLWDLREGKEVKSWTAHKSGVLSIAFAPDGRIVTCGRDKIVRLWDRDGNKLQEFEPFHDVALSAVVSRDRVIAGDWTGTVRVWNADGKRLAELAPNPPALAERLAGVNNRIAELQSRRESAATLLADADKAAAKSSAEAREAAQAADEKGKQLKAAGEQVATLGKESDDANAALQKARTDYSQLQAATEPLNADLAKAVAANDASQNDLKLLEGAMQEKQARADQLADAAKAAQALADKQPGDQSLADAAAKAKADAAKAQEDLAAGQKSVTAGEEDAQHAKDALAKANEAVTGNKDALGTAKQKMDEQAAAAEKLATGLASAKETLAKTQGEFDEMSGSLPPKATQAEAAVQVFSKAKHDAQEIDRQLAVANGDLAKWKSAVLNVSLYAARQELDARQSDEAQAVAAAHDASAELDKARDALAAAEKALADAPARIKAREEAIAQAHTALDKANADTAAAKETAAHKETLIPPASDFSTKLDAESSQTPDDATLKIAAAKAKDLLDLLNRDLDASRKAVDARIAGVKQASDNLAAAEQALTNEKSDIDAAPDAIAKLHAAMDETAARTADARAAAEKKAADARQPVLDAQGKVDALARDYEKMTHEAQAAYATVAELAK